MKAAAYYLGTGLIILAVSVLLDCSRDKKPDYDDVCRRIEAIKKKLESQNSYAAEHIDSVRARILAFGDTALYDSVEDDLESALFYLQEGDEVWTELDAMQYELL